MPSRDPESACHLRFYTQGTPLTVLASGDLTQRLPFLPGKRGDPHCSLVGLWLEHDNTCSA